MYTKLPIYTEQKASTVFDVLPIERRTSFTVNINLLRKIARLINL